MQTYQALCSRFKSQVGDHQGVMIKISGAHHDDSVDIPLPFISHLHLQQLGGCRFIAVKQHRRQSSSTELVDWQSRHTHIDPEKTTGIFHRRRMSLGILLLGTSDEKLLSHKGWTSDAPGG